MRTLRNILRKILFGRAFGGLEWPQVAALRDRLVKRSQATPEADDDLPGIEYLGWLLAARSKRRAGALLFLATVAAAFCFHAGGMHPGGDSHTAATCAFVIAGAWLLYGTRKLFLEEARQAPPAAEGQREQAEASLVKAELAVRRLRREMPECFWALVMRVDATRIVASQLDSCADVKQAGRLLFQARGRIQPWGEPATDRLKRLEASCAKLWPNLEDTLRLFDPGLLEAAGENVIIETAAPPPPAEPPTTPPPEQPATE